MKRKYLITDPETAEDLRKALREEAGYPKRGVPQDDLAARFVPKTYAPGAPGWTEDVFIPRRHPTRPDEAAIPMDEEVEKRIADSNGNPRRIKNPRAGRPDIQLDRRNAVELDDTWEEDLDDRGVPRTRVDALPGPRPLERG